MPHVRSPFEALCVVCWQRDKTKNFEVGVHFIDGDRRFRARMVEQVYHIEDYLYKRLQLSGLVSLQRVAARLREMHIKY